MILLSAWINSEPALKAGVFSFSAKPVTPEAGVVGPWPLPSASRFQAPSTPWPGSLLLSVATRYPNTRRDGTLLTRLPVDRRAGCFHVLAIMGNAAANICVFCVSVYVWGIIKCKWTKVWSSLMGFSLSGGTRSVDPTSHPPVGAQHRVLCPELASQKSF